MRWSPFILGVAIVALLAGTTMVAAHAPPEPRAMDTRILTDAHDDCGNHAQQGCMGGLDLLALSLREVHDETHGDGIVFSLWYAPGAPQASHAVTIEAGLSGRQETMAIDLEQQDGEWQANGSYAIDGPYPIGDDATDDRVGIDLWYALDTLNLTIDDRLFGFEVTSRIDETIGDIMPGTYVTDDGTQAEPSDAEQNEPTALETLFYALGNPPRYIDLTGPAVFDVEPGTSQSWTIIVTNVLQDAPQTVRIHYAAPDGIEVRAGAASVEGPDTTLASLDPRGSEAIQVVLAVEANADIAGGITITYYTDLGGFATYTVPLTLAEQTSLDEDHDAPAATGAGLAGIGWVVGAGIIVAIATVLLGRRPKA